MAMLLDLLREYEAVSIAAAAVFVAGYAVASLLFVPRLADAARRAPAPPSVGQVENSNDRKIKGFGTARDEIGVFRDLSEGEARIGPVAAGPNRSRPDANFEILKAYTK